MEFNTLWTKVDFGCKIWLTQFIYYLFTAAAARIPALTNAATAQHLSSSLVLTLFQVNYHPSRNETRRYKEVRNFQTTLISKNLVWQGWRQITPGATSHRGGPRTAACSLDGETKLFHHPFPKVSLQHEEDFVSNTLSSIGWKKLPVEQYFKEAWQSLRKRLFVNL